MNSRRLVPLITVTIVAQAWAALTAAQQPGYPKFLATDANNLGISSPPNGFLGLGLAVETDQDKRPFICYGLRQVGKDYKYTYFIVFKTDRTKKWELGNGVGGNGTIAVGGADGATLEKMHVHFGDRPSNKKVEISYKFEADKKTGDLISESLKVNGEEYKKDGPRVFLCDLTLDKPTCNPLKASLPDHVPKIDGDAQATSKALIQALQQLAEKSPEVKESFEDQTKK